MDRTHIKLDEVLFAEEWDYSNPDAMGVLIKKERVHQFTGTSLEPLFSYIEEHIDEIMMPELTFYWQFLTDGSKDSYIFGGIQPEVLGTIYLTPVRCSSPFPRGCHLSLRICQRG